MWANKIYHDYFREILSRLYLDESVYGMIVPRKEKDCWKMFNFNYAAKIERYKDKVKIIPMKGHGRAFIAYCSPDVFFMAQSDEVRELMKKRKWLK